MGQKSSCGEKCRCEEEEDDDEDDDARVDWDAHVDPSTFVSYAQQPQQPTYQVQFQQQQFPPPPAQFQQYASAPQPEVRKQQPTERPSPKPQKPAAQTAPQAAPRQQAPAPQPARTAPAPAPRAAPAPAQPQQQPVPDGPLGKFVMKNFQAPTTDQSMHKAFDYFDMYQNKKISEVEFDQGLEGLHAKGNQERWARAFYDLDKNRDGRVSYNEFSTALTRGHV